MVVPKAGQSEKKMVYNEITWRIEEGGAQYWRGEMMMVPSKEREKKKNKKTH